MFCTAIVGFSQVKLDYTAKPKAEAKGFSAKGLSATSAQFLYQLKQAEATADRSAKASAYAKLQREYDLVQGKVSAVVVLASGKTVQDLSAYDVTVGVVSGNLVTVTIPVSRFAELAESGVCSSINMGGEQHLMLDNVRPNLGIDMIHAGMNLPQGYDGSGVVVGVIALWMQHNPSLGTDSARAILHSTARNDRYTGNCVSTPSNIWGHGKVNAFGGLPVNTSMWLLNTFSETDVFGYVEGGGVVVEGTHTITAIPNTNHIFVAWEDGVTDNPRTVNVTCDTTFIALFSQISYEDCDTIEDFPWTAEFDENFTCWKLIDADGDGSNWAKFPATIASLGTGPSVTNLDNWLVSPAIQVNQHLKAKMSTRCISPIGSQDCSILLSTSGSETTDFTTVLGTHTFTSTEVIVFSLPLDNYQGQTVRIVVRHHNCATLAASLFLNDFSIEVVEDSVSVPSYVGMRDVGL